MNYVPNVSAKSLVMKKTYTIGLFFSSIDQGTSASFLVDAIKGIHRALDENYSLTVHGIDGIRHLEGISPHRFDGILVMSQSDADNAFIYHVKKAGIPLVVLNRHLDDPGIANVVANDREGVREAIDYAIGRGHRRLAIIEGKAGFRSAAERKQGFLESLLAHELSLPAEYQAAGDYSIDSGFRRMLALLELPDPPTLVFCANDDMAIGAMNACFARAVSVPDQVSLIGFDDIVFASYTESGPDDGPQAGRRDQRARHPQADRAVAAPGAGPSGKGAVAGHPVRPDDADDPPIGGRDLTADG
ncbi:hypothetical protein HMSSN139_55300 [Paenibacillus sp. HMSSN-139]|nr:hypothetical protein HMSSN139_55300 [Paenibacillus sp. HMSSN-139]